MIHAEEHVREVVTVFFAQRWIILGTTLIFTLIALLVVFWFAPLHAITAKLLVKGKKIEKSQEALEQTQLRMFEISKEDLFSEVEILSSNDVVAGTVTRLWEKKLLSDPMTPSEENRRTLVKEIQSALKTQIVPNANILNIELVSKVPEEGVVILENLIEEYMRQRGDVFNPSGSVAFFEGQSLKFDRGLRQAEGRLKDLAFRSQTVDPGMEIQKNLGIKQELESQLNGYTNQMIEKELLVGNLKRAMASKEPHFFSFIDNPSINSFSEKLQALVLQRGGLLRVYHPESVKIMRVDEQVDATYAALKKEVSEYLQAQENRLNIIKETTRSLEERIRAIDSTNVALNDIQVEANRVTRDLDLMKHSYDTFAKRLEEARINAASGKDSLFSIRVIDKPFYGGVPFFPNGKTLIPVGILAGLLTGFSLGFIREFFDHTFKRPEDVTKALDEPLLFSIPRW